MKLQLQEQNNDKRILFVVIASANSCSKQSLCCDGQRSYSTAQNQIFSDVS